MRHHGQHLLHGEGVSHLPPTLIADQSSTALDSYVSELGSDISYEKRCVPQTSLCAEVIADISLSSSRFLKSIVARHKYGPLVLKIFIKPNPSMTLRVIQRRLNSETTPSRDVSDRQRSAMRWRTCRMCRRTRRSSRRTRRDI